MIYAILVRIFRLALRVYFRKINVQFTTPLATDRPIVLVSNHPSALMDAILIAGLVDPALHFMSRGESFDKPFKRWLFSLFHMHPIYRREFTPELTRLNPKMMSHFQELLATGHNLLIFPEGISKTELRLRKVKSGAARIVLGAMANSEDELEIQLIPVGLNYSNPHRFGSEVSVNFGAAIPLESFAKQYQQAEREAVRALTQRIATEIGRLTVEIENKQLDELVASVEQLCEEELLSEAACQQQQWSWLKARQEIAGAVNYFSDCRPEVLRRLQPLIRNYHDRLLGQELDDRSLLGLAKSSGRRLLIGLPALPFFLYAYLNCLPILKASRWLTKSFTRRPDFYGSLLLAFGVLCALVFVGLQLSLVYYLSGGVVLTIGYAITLPLSYWICSRYYQDFRLLGQWWRLCLGSAKDWRQISGLLEEREHLLKELRDCWRSYLRWAGADRRA